MNDGTRLPVKRDDLVTRYIAGEAIIVPVKEGVGDLGSIYTLNETGARIWELIDGETPAPQIAAVLSAEYEVGEEEAGKDVADFLSQLHEARLLQAEPGDPA